MRTGNSHTQKKIPETVRQNWVYMSFWTERKGENEISDVKSENEQFTGNWGRAEHAWQANSCLGGTARVTQPPGPCLEPPVQETPWELGEEESPKIVFLEQALPSERLRQERRRGKVLSESLFLNNRLKINTPKGSCRVLVPFCSLQWECSVLVIRKKAMKLFFTLK